MDLGGGREGESGERETAQVTHGPSPINLAHIRKHSSTNIINNHLYQYLVENDKEHP